jgi:hypothetical protein
MPEPCLLAVGKMHRRDRAICVAPALRELPSLAARRLVGQRNRGALE